jgi:hypothetical protein
MNEPLARAKHWIKSFIYITFHFMLALQGKLYGLSYFSDEETGVIQGGCVSGHIAFSDFSRIFQTCPPL